MMPNDNAPAGATGDESAPGNTVVTVETIAPQNGSTSAETAVAENITESPDSVAKIGDKVNDITKQVIDVEQIIEEEIQPEINEAQEWRLKTEVTLAAMQESMQIQTETLSTLTSLMTDMLQSLTIPPSEIPGEQQTPQVLSSADEVAPAATAQPAEIQTQEQTEKRTKEKSAAKAGRGWI